MRGARAATEDLWGAIASGCPLPNSFSPSTPVRTLSGLVAISALSLGTPVLAFNEQTGENGYYPITAVITHGTKGQGVAYLTINDPEQGNKPEFIETTPEHPFYVQQPANTTPRPQPEGHADLSAKWVGAGHLKVGDQIKQADGTVGVIANVVTVQQTQEMFNLMVDNVDDQFVHLRHVYGDEGDARLHQYAAEDDVAGQAGGLGRRRCGPGGRAW